MADQPSGKPSIWNTTNPKDYPPALRATFGVVSVVSIAVIVWIIVMTSRHSDVGSTPATLQDLDPGTVQTQCEQAAKEQLRAPDSFDTVGGAASPKWYSDHWGFSEDFSTTNQGVTVRFALACTVTGSMAADARADVDLVPR